MSAPLVLGGAERAFRITDLRTDTEHVTGAMPTGPWVCDRDGHPVAGSLGVLADDVLGYALIRGRPEGRWSVSSEITVDVVRPLRFDGQMLHSTTVGTVRHDDLGAHTSGTVTCDGEVVAVCSQRGRWVPFDGTFVATAPPPPEPTPATCVEDLLGAGPARVEGGAALRLVVTPALQNPLGNLHGGLSLCASDLAASAAVTAWAAPWATESLRIQYLRPVPAGAEVEFRAAVRHAGRSRALVDVVGVVDGRVCTQATVVGRPATKDA